MINLIATTPTIHLGKIIKKNSNNFKVIFIGRSKDNKKYFPDNEVYARLPEVNNLSGRTVILHSGAPDPNDGLMELRIILEILKENKVAPVEIFFSYFPYGMQDHVDQAGATNVAKHLISGLVNYYAVAKIYTIDAHFWGSDWVKNYPLVNVGAVDLLKERVQKNNPNIIFITPDQGAERRTGIKGVEKQRINSFITHFKKNNWLAKTVRNQTVGVIDDLLKTGGTLAGFYDECKKNQATKIFALITHGVLPKGIARIEKKYDGLYLTNTIKQKTVTIDVSPLIIRAIDK